MEKFVIHNNSLMEAEIHFYLQHDTKATTFFLAPSNMTLQPNEKKVSDFTSSALFQGMSWALSHFQMCKIWLELILH